MTKPRIAVAGIPGKWSTTVLADAISERVGDCLLVDMGKTELQLDTRPRLVYEGEDLCTYDAVVVKKISQRYSPATLDRVELLRFAEQLGVRVFSPCDAMLGLIDRLACTVTLAANGIPMPETRVTESIEQALDAVSEFGSVVLKPLYSTKARGMVVLEDHEGENTLREKLLHFNRDNPVMYIQKRITRLERDMGLAFLGGRYLGAYARVSDKAAWNTTIQSGGKYRPCEPGDHVIALAERAQAPFGLDFTTVDIAETEHGPVVFEVSAFGGFRGALEGAGINVAAAYADYVIQELDKQ